MPPRPFPPFRASLSALLVVPFLIQASGCMRWQQLEQPAPVALAKHGGHLARVTLTEGWVLIADSVRVADSSLVLLPNWSVTGNGRGPVPAATDSAGRAVFLLSSVAGIEVRKAHPWRALGLVIGVVVVVPVLIVLFDCVTSSGDSYVCP